jgi:hypothetical protein
MSEQLAYVPDKYKDLLDQMDTLKEGVEVTLYQSENQRSKKWIEKGATTSKDKPRVSLRKNKQVQKLSGGKEASR